MLRSKKKQIPKGQRRIKRNKKKKNKHKQRQDSKNDKVTARNNSWTANSESVSQFSDVIQIQNVDQKDTNFTQSLQNYNDDEKLSKYSTDVQNLESISDATIENSKIDITLVNDANLVEEAKTGPDNIPNSDSPSEKSFDGKDFILAGKIKKMLTERLKQFKDDDWISM